MWGGVCVWVLGGGRGLLLYCIGTVGHYYTTHFWLTFEQALKGKSLAGVCALPRRTRGLLMADSNYTLVKHPADSWSVCRKGLCTDIISHNQAFVSYTGPTVDVRAQKWGNLITKDIRNVTCVLGVNCALCLRGPAFPLNWCLVAHSCQTAASILKVLQVNPLVRIPGKEERKVVCPGLRKHFYAVKRPFKLG